MKAKLVVSVASVVGLLASTFANAANFTESYLDGGSWNSVYAQGFSPGVAPNPDLGLSPGDPVELQQFQFFKSGQDDNPNDIRLAIISPFFSDIMGMNTSSTYLVGLSDSTINGTAGIAVGDPISFDFSSLAMTAGTSYGAVFVTQSGSDLTPVFVPALVADYVETAPGSGVFVPESNYGTNSQFDYAVSNFISSTIASSFFNTFSEAADANFYASFTTVIPEPGSMALLLGALVVTSAAGRRRLR